MYANLGLMISSKLNIRVFFFICLLLSGKGNSQTILDEFSIDVTQGQVLLAWTIKSGSLCNGIQIYRSIDSLNFSEIKNIDGICGDLSSPVYYTYTDQNPIQNETNYYKLALGGEGESDILGIEVLFVPANSYLLRPNPISGTADLYFENANNENIELKIYDDLGSVIHKKSTNTNRFILDSSMISTGLYYFTIINQASNRVINGRALFLH
jgi:hypothetical protein